MSRPDSSSEGITVPRGDPDALRGAAQQLRGLEGQLEGVAARNAAFPSLASRWSGPSSSAFAGLASRQAQAARAMQVQVRGTAAGMSLAASALQDAQRAASRAIERADEARRRIDVEKRRIRVAKQEQVEARERIGLAEAAEAAADALASGLDVVGGGAAAHAASEAAAREQRAAERDLQDASDREQQARERLADHEDDLRRARKDGREAATDAESAGTSLQMALSGAPPGMLQAPGAPAVADVRRAGGLYRPPSDRDLSPAERVARTEPPKHWPGALKAYYKVGRGGWTAIYGVAGLGGKVVRNPEKVPGGLANLAKNTATDPLGTGKSLIAYDEFASGRWEDGVGQLGVGALSGGVGTVGSRAARLARVRGPASPKPLDGVSAPRNALKFGGRKMDFAAPGLGARQGHAPALPTYTAARLDGLAQKYPKGVRYTRAGSPIFTPYTELARQAGYEAPRVRIEQTGNHGIDFRRANEAAGLGHGRRAPDGFTWHHVEDGKTMELVPKDLHEAAQHTGSAGALRQQSLVPRTPGADLNPFERGVGATGAGLGYGVSQGGAGGSG